jgi:hypothetical protein
MRNDLYPTKPKQISRREVLKALVALGGAAAASTLMPEKWIPPVVATGVLPAHAQSSFCDSAVRLFECSDVAAHWFMEPELILRVESMAILSSVCIGVPLRFSFILKDSSGVTVFTSDNYVFLTSQFGDADAMVFVSHNKISGIPSSGFAHWEFADPRVGQTTCDWLFGVDPVP